MTWLTKFDDHFNISKDARLKEHLYDELKAGHLIAKLQDPARSRINVLNASQKKSFKELVAFLKQQYLTETTKVLARHELHKTVQGLNESVQHFANRIAKLVERANHDISDPDALDRRKIYEFIYKSRDIHKLALKTYTTYEEVVKKASTQEQMADLYRNQENEILGKTAETKSNIVYGKDKTQRLF